MVFVSQESVCFSPSFHPADNFSFSYMFLNLPILLSKPMIVTATQLLLPQKEWGHFGLGHPVGQGPSLLSSLPSAGMQEEMKAGAGMCTTAAGAWGCQTKQLPVAHLKDLPVGWEVVVLPVGSALHHLLQSRLCTPKPCQVLPCQSQVQSVKAIQSSWGWSSSPQRGTTALPMFSQDLNFQYNSQK